MLEPEEQISGLEAIRKIIQEKFGNVIVEIYRSDAVDLYDPTNKVPKSRPMKPAIFIE